LSTDPTLQGEALLESAKENLQKLDCVLFFEHFTEDVIHLFNRFGIEIEEQEIPHINVTVKEPISESLLERIKKLNKWDMLLYEYAKTELQKKETIYSFKKYPYF